MGNHATLHESGDARGSERYCSRQLASPRNLTRRSNPPRSTALTPRPGARPGCEEEPQARDMAVHGRRRHPRLALLDLEPTNVFRCGEIRRPSEESGETRDDAQIIMLGLRRKTPDVHIFDHSLP